MRWLVRYDPPSCAWYAMPLWREWVADWDTEQAYNFGPRGSKGFETLSAAMEYAYDLHHCYQDGWLA